MDMLAVRKQLPPFPGSMLIVVGFFLVWALPRMVAMADNPLLFDDYYIGVPGTPIEPGPWIHNLSFRPMQYLSHVFWEWVLGEGFFLSIAPKVIAGLYVSIAVMFTHRYLLAMGVSFWSACIPCVMFLTHVVVNEITLWNTAFSIPLGFAMAAGGYCLITRRCGRGREMTAGILVFGACMTYQPLFFVALSMWMLDVLLLIFMAGARETAFVRYAARNLFIIVVATGAYVACVVLSKYLWEHTDPRGFPHVTDLSTYLVTSFKGVINLYVNSVMPLLTYYFGIQTAWSKWEFLPIAVAVVTLFAMLIRKAGVVPSLLLAFAVLSMPFAPALIAAMASSVPESWRVASASTFALCLSLVPAMGLICGDLVPGSKDTGNGNPGLHPLPTHNLLAVVLTVSVFGIAYYPARYDAELRGQSVRHEQSILEDISTYWKQRNIDPALVSVVIAGDRNLVSKQELLQSARLTVAYEPRTEYSSLVNHFSSFGFLHRNGLSQLTPEDVSEAGFPDNLLDHCVQHPNAHYRGSGWRVAHFPDSGVTVICR